MILDKLGCLLIMLEYWGNFIKLMVIVIFLFIVVYLMLLIKRYFSVFIVKKNGFFVEFGWILVGFVKVMFVFDSFGRREILFVCYDLNIF